MFTDTRQVIVYEIVGIVIAPSIFAKAYSIIRISVFIALAVYSYFNRTHINAFSRDGRVWMRSVEKFNVTVYKLTIFIHYVNFRGSACCRLLLSINNCIIRYRSIFMERRSTVVPNCPPGKFTVQVVSILRVGWHFRFADRIASFNKSHCIERVVISGVRFSFIIKCNNTMQCIIRLNFIPASTVCYAHILEISVRNNSGFGIIIANLNLPDVVGGR